MQHASLVAAIDGLPQQTFQGIAFRHLPPQYSPLSGDGARMIGGRWNPPESFSVLYLGVDRQTVIDEFRRLVMLQGRQPEDVLPRLFVEYEVVLGDVLDLRPPGALAMIGLTEADLRADDRSNCQAVGAAAHDLGREAIIAPSAAGEGTTLNVFIDALHAGSTVVPTAREQWSDMP